MLTGTNPHLSLARSLLSLARSTLSLSLAACIAVVAKMQMHACHADAQGMPQRRRRLRGGGREEEAERRRLRGGG
jgi:hypothetical protein